MNKFVRYSENKHSSPERKSERGAALVVAILVMLLLLGFVSFVISRVSSETIITANDSAENRAFGAAEARLEVISRKFADVFETKLSPTNTDINDIKTASIPGFINYDFTSNVNQVKASQATEITGGTYSGLYSLRDEWEIGVIAKETNSGVESEVKRRFLNDRIPLFQFGIFFEDDLELNRPPLFTFGGRVHTNQSLFISAYPVSASGGIYFKSKATAVGEVVNDIWKTGQSLTAGTDNQNGIFIADAGGTFRELNTSAASVTCVNPSGTNVFASRPDAAYLPNCSRRTNWTTDKLAFQGNLDTNVPRLDLPLYRLKIPLIELIKRGKNVGDLENNGSSVVGVTAAREDNGIVARERFANKQGLRVSLADAQNRLPCANGCGGVRLDAGTGYQPKTMQDGYKATAFNAPRFAQNSKEIWIKIELVNFDYNTGKPVTTDVTEDILSLGITEVAPIANNFQIADYDTNKTDSRSIVKLQRFAIEGPAISNPHTDHDTRTFLTDKSINGKSYNLAVRYTSVTGTTGGCDKTTGTLSNSFSAPPPSATYSASSSPGSDPEKDHLRCVRFNNGNNDKYNTMIAPVPIQLFDTREGVPSDATSYTGVFDYYRIVPRAGVMSLVDIDVYNLRRFLMGEYDSDGKRLPSTGTTFSGANGRSLRSTDVPENRGWVVYFSDRRGDSDFDGQYDMEDVFPDDALQFNEDVNGNGALEKSSSEAPGYYDWLFESQAAATSHGYYRRGVRLINGELLPGVYDSATPSATRGFTLASENGVYVKGNYNATGVTLSGTSAPAPSKNYLPQNTSQHIPAAIVADAVTILSRDWNDGKSFNTPFDPDSRKASATVVRFAMLSGDGITGKTASNSYNPSTFGQLNGGVHNFKRYLETWTNVRLNYVGSLVNLFNSQNNNGYFKCCSAVYNPPIRDWSFDTTFVDPNRLPPGTPFIYSITFTGFQRVND